MGLFIVHLFWCASKNSLVQFGLVMQDKRCPHSCSVHTTHYTSKALCHMATLNHNFKSNTVHNQYVCALYHNTVIRHSMNRAPQGERGGRKEGRIGRGREEETTWKQSKSLNGFSRALYSNVEKARQCCAFSLPVDQLM